MVSCRMCEECCCLDCGGRRCAFCGEGYCQEDADFDECALCADSGGCPRCVQMDTCDVCERTLCAQCATCQQCEQCCWLVCNRCDTCGCDRIRNVIDQSKVPVTRRHANQLSGSPQRG